jgi:hypothetical protein
MLQGDVLVATVTGTVTGGGTPGVVTGRVTSSVHGDIVPPIWGNQALRMVTEWYLTQTSGTTFVIRNQYVEQDDAGSVYEMGWSDAAINARLTSTSAAPMVFPSPMGFGQHYAYTARYADGSTQNVTWTVVGQEVVDGRLAYRIHVAITDTGTTKSEDYWFLPSIGYPVKWTATIQQGTTLYRLTATLLWRDYGILSGAL